MERPDRAIAPTFSNENYPSEPPPPEISTGSQVSAAGETEGKTQASVGLSMYSTDPAVSAHSRDQLRLDFAAKKIEVSGIGAIIVVVVGILVMWLSQ